MKGHIRERSSGHWAIVIDVSDPQTGQRKRRWYSFQGTKRAAQSECARLLAAQEAGTAVEPSRLTVAGLSREMARPRPPAGEPAHHRAICRDCRRISRPGLGADAAVEAAANGDLDCL